MKVSFVWNPMRHEDLQGKIKILRLHLDPPKVDSCSMYQVLQFDHVYIEQL